MEQEKAESYRALYRVRPLIYHIGDIRLWMPIRQDGVVLWFVYLFVFFVLCYLIPVLSWIVPLDRMMIMAVGPVAAAYYTVKLDPAGKTVPRYLRDVLRFFLRPKWLVRWHSIRHPGHQGRIHFRGRCRNYKRIRLANGQEEWQGSAGQSSGVVQVLDAVTLPARYSVHWRGRSGQLLLSPLKRTPRKPAILPAMWEKPAGRSFVCRTDQSMLLVRKYRADNRVLWKAQPRGDGTEGTAGE